LLAVHFLSSTDNPAKLKQLLGHSTIKSTEQYLKYTVEDIREEYAEASPWQTVIVVSKYPFEPY